ncbi:hypothetical protein KGM_214424A, partial [Danaus plexippus plexippus]
MSRVETVR